MTDGKKVVSVPGWALHVLMECYLRDWQENDHTKWQVVGGGNPPPWLERGHLPEAWTEVRKAFLDAHNDEHKGTI